jgi:hypothetical protein
MNVNVSFAQPLSVEGAFRIAAEVSAAPEWLYFDYEAGEHEIHGALAIAEGSGPGAAETALEDNIRDTFVDGMEGIGSADPEMVQWGEEYQRAIVSVVAEEGILVTSMDVSASQAMIEVLFQNPAVDAVHEATRIRR